MNLFNSSGSPVIRGCGTAAALFLHLCAMNGMVMAVPAHHQGLPLARGHLADPGRWLASPRSAKISQLPDVMDLDLLLGAAELTGIGEKPFTQFRSGVVLPLGQLVIKDCQHVAPKGDGSPLRYQWLLAFALDHRAQDLASSVWCIDGDRVTSIHP